MRSPAQTRGLEMARELFMEDPDLSVDSSARIISAQCGSSPHKSLLAAVRRQVRESLAKNPKPAAPPAAPFNPPRLIAVTPAPEKQPEPSPAPTGKDRAS